MDEQREPEQPIGETYTTACNHYWVESPDQDPNSDLVSLRCTKCISGASINPDQTLIVDGKMRSNA